MKRKSIFAFCLSVFFLVGLFFCGCSDNEYLTSVPKDCPLIASVETEKGGQPGSQSVLKALLGFDDVDSMGVDWSEKIYFFVLPEGNYGLCAKLNSAGQLRGKIEKNGIEIHKRQGNEFALVNKAWLLGYSKDALLITGPVTPTLAGDAESQLTRYLRQDEERSILHSPLFEKLDSTDSPMAMVSRITALPRQIGALSLLGIPKGTEKSKVLKVAEISVQDGFLSVSSRFFSFDADVEKQLREAESIFKPIQGKYKNCIPDDVLLSISMNVEGSKLLPLLQADDQLQVMLTGINAAIDMDNIIKSINGDMTLVIPAFQPTGFSASLRAQLAHKDWLKDVGYWKKSVPEGGRIGDWGRNAYYYSDNKTSFYFGVSDDNQFYSGQDKKAALASIQPVRNPLNSKIREKIVNGKMVAVLNLSGENQSAEQVLPTILKSVFGNVQTVVYQLK